MGRWGRFCGQESCWLTEIGYKASPSSALFMESEQSRKSGGSSHVRGDVLRMSKETREGKIMALRRRVEPQTDDPMGDSTHNQSKEVAEDYGKGNRLYEFMATQTPITAIIGLFRGRNRASERNVLIAERTESSASYAKPVQKVQVCSRQQCVRACSAPLQKAHAAAES